MKGIAVLQLAIVLLLSPFLLGVVNRTKAFFAGRKGQPLFQLYYDIAKLLRKGAVYSKTTTWIFIAGPIIGLSATLTAMSLIPFAGQTSLISFNGDLILFVYLLGIARFFTVIAALDTGSSFEGMGASREVQFAVLAEPALFLSLAAFARATNQLSISGMFSSLHAHSWGTLAPILILVIPALIIIFLTENSRVPIDDPNTHLELTMIHEVMVLDHGGIDFAYIIYGSSLKFWLFGTLIVNAFFKLGFHSWYLDFIAFAAGMIFLSIIVGAIESVLARLRLLNVPHLLVIALSFSILALAFQMR